MLPMRTVRLSVPRTVAITGGAGALGRELASLYARRGYSLALSDVGAAALDEAAMSIRAAVPGARISTVCVDVSDAAAVSAWLQAAHANAALEFVFVNAGVSGAGKDPFESLRVAVSVNVLGAANTAAAAAEVWLASVNDLSSCPGSRESCSGPPRGRIVFISSLLTSLPRVPRLAGEEGNWQQCWYYLTKKQLGDLSVSMRELLKPHKVAVTLAKPGYFSSNLLAECMESSGVSSRLAATTLTPASVAASIAKACDDGVKEHAFGVSGTYQRHGPTQKLINLCPLWLARKLRAWKLASERAAASKAAAGKAAAAWATPCSAPALAKGPAEAPTSI